MWPRWSDPFVPTIVRAMYTPLGRVLCGILSLMLFAHFVSRGAVYGWVFLLPAPLLIYGYVRYGTVTLAFQAYHQRNWPRLERLLRQTRWPERLRAQDRAYYEFLCGAAAQARGDTATAHTYFAAVEPELLRTDNIRSILECHRAEVALACGDGSAARQHLDSARRYPHRAEVAAAIQALESALAQGR